MKKIFSILMLSLVALNSQQVSAYDFTANGADGRQMYFDYVGNDEVVLTYEHEFAPTASYYGPIEVPSTVKDEHQMYQVVGIGPRAFYGCRTLMSVTMPETIKRIGACAFASCSALTELEIPATVEYISSDAFDGCYNLMYIAVAKGSDKYSDATGVLSDRSKDTIISYPQGREGDYMLPMGTKAVGQRAFASCHFLTDATLPDGVETIDDYAFYYCNALEGINIPATVTSIGHNALNDCFNLQSIEVSTDNAVYASIDGVLYDKSAERLIQSPGGQVGLAAIDESTRQIANNAFFRNMGITTVQMPSAINTIGEAAFTDSRQLSTVQLPDSLTEIGDMAFAMCPHLAGVYLRVSDPGDIKMGTAVFEESNTDSCTLYVPEVSVALYAKAPQWSAFKSIEAIDALKEQTIEWIQQPTDSVTVGTRLPLNATSTSGLPVKYAVAPTSLPYVELTDDWLTILSPGVIKITAYQPGDKEYLPATPVTIKIDKVTGIDDVLMPGHDIKVVGGRGIIIIKGVSEKAYIEVYDINGMKIYEGYDTVIPVASDQIYVVRVDGSTHKVIVL